MEIGIKIGPATDRAELKQLAQAAERIGFDHVWLSERVAVPLDRPHPYQPAVDPWVALAFVAAVTERVRLGTSVSQIALRPPVLMARELATLDRLSAGRVIVGAGAGWVEEEFSATGVPFETRGGRLNEFLELLRHLWTKPEEPWQGKHFQVLGVGLVRPLTAGGPPLYVGAGGPPGLRRAAKYGDGFIAVTLPVETLARLRQRLDALRARYGRAGPFPFLAQAPTPATVDEARELVRSRTGARVDGLILTAPDSVTPGRFLENEAVVRALIEAGSESASA